MSNYFCFLVAPDTAFRYNKAMRETNKNLLSGERCMEDLRKIKSKELLKDAFWRVLKSKKYAQIFIKDIVTEAGINRKTFTAHYESVDALMRDCVKELIQKLLSNFDVDRKRGVVDFSYSTREYTRFALENREHLQLIFSNQLDSVALHLWKELLVASQTFSLENNLRYDLYLNYTTYCCWGNLLWVLDHADLPLDELVSEALDVYRIFAVEQSSLYEMPDYGRLISHSK